MTLLQYIQWFLVAASVMPAIIFYFRPRTLQRALLQKCLFNMQTDQGIVRMTGYILSRQVVTSIFEQEPVTIKRPAFKSAELITYFIIEPAKKHPKNGYENVLVDSRYVTLL